MAWHDGRTFYGCPCSWRAEHIGDDAPLTLPCDGCKGGIMVQWVPPAVAAERAGGRKRATSVAKSDASVRGDLGHQG